MIDDIKKALSGVIGSDENKRERAEYNEEELQSANPDLERELSQQPLDEEIEQEIESQRETIQELQSQLKAKEQDEDARTARLEERLQEIQQQKKQLEDRVSQQSEKIRDVQNTQSTATVSTPPPDSKIIKDKPVISADGVKNFGKFKGWINEADKIGIKTKHPNRGNEIVKVGWAQNIRDLVVDPYTLKDKDVIIVKVDGHGNKVEDNIVSMGRHREIVDKKEKLEDQKQRLSMENDELIQQNRKLERLNKKLITSISMLKMDTLPDNGEKDLIISKMQSERDMMKQQTDNLAEQQAHRRGREQEIISQYENMMGDQVERLSESETEESIKMAGETMQDLIRHIVGKPLNELDPEMREDLLSSMMGGSGGAINIKEE